MDTGTEIRDAVKIVIQQMREHPEDFEDPSSRFGWLHSVDLTKLGFNKAEIEAFDAGLADMRYRKFHNAVLEAMLEESPFDHTSKYMLTEKFLGDPTIRIRNRMQVQGNSLKPAP